MTPRNFAVELGALVRKWRINAGQTQAEIAAAAMVKQGRLAHLEQGVEVIPAKALRWIAYACGVDAVQTIQAITLAALAKRRPALSVEGLTEKQVQRIARAIEHARRVNGFHAACGACNAGPMAECVEGCRGEKAGVRHG